jgi:Protein of unknown function (DUF3370)
MDLTQPTNLLNPPRYIQAIRQYDQSALDYCPVMFGFLASLTLIAQAAPSPMPSPTPSPTPVPQEFLVRQEMRALPGQLDSVLVFNSNSPELVLNEGILLSTFPGAGKRTPAAHLNQPLEGRFDLFAHHIAKAPTPDDLRSLYLGIILYNPSSQPVTVDILPAASYLSQPDAPFIDLPPFVDNADGKIFAGPGSRAVNEVLRGKRQPDFLPQLVVPAGAYRMLMNLPIPVRPLQPPLNGRSTLTQLRSSGKIYVASLALFAKPNPDGSERPPTLAEWQDLLINGALSTPRDRPPTPLDQKTGSLAYGRVAGVAQGAQWQARLTDPQGDRLTIPAPGKGFSYGLSLLHRGTMGTNQIQSGNMIARYPDTAYQAHGNYGVRYSLTLPLHNPSAEPRTVTIAVENPLKREDTQRGLYFFQPLPRNVFFRGTVRLLYTDDAGLPKTRYVHLVMRRGQQGEPLATLKMPPGDRRLVQFDLIYPPDATPPQVLTVKTVAP